MKIVYLFIVSKSDDTGAYGNAIAEDGETLGYIDGNSTQEVKNALQEKNYPGYQKEWVEEEDKINHPGLKGAIHNSFNQKK